MTTVTDLILLANEKTLLQKAVFSKPENKTLVKTVLTPRQVGKKTVLQAETIHQDNKATHENIAAEDAERVASLADGFGQINLFTTVGTAEYRKSKSGTKTVIGGDALFKKMNAENAPTAEITGNNLEKEHLLHGDEPFLILLGVSDEKGRIKDKKQSKFRQINRFLEMIRDCLPKLPAEGTLRICDLCCGKSYLSFAAYHYFANVLNRKVKMTGVDLKSDVIAYCNGVAKKLRFDGLEFLCGDVAKYDTEDHVHLVITLHACDFATDLVLRKAVDWNADVILSTPCCHHEMNHTLACSALSFIAEHSMLRQKLCDAATDALRLKRLEANGYSVAALELIDPEETPKNVLLRAFKKESFSQKDRGRLTAEYETAKAFFVGDADTVHF